MTGLSRNTVAKSLHEPLVARPPQYLRVAKAVKLTPFHEAPVPRQPVQRERRPMVDPSIEPAPFLAGSGTKCLLLFSGRLHRSSVTR